MAEVFHPNRRQRQNLLRSQHRPPQQINTSQLATKQPELYDQLRRQTLDVSVCLQYYSSNTDFNETQPFDNIEKVLHLIYADRQDPYGIISFPNQQPGEYFKAALCWRVVKGKVVKRQRQLEQQRQLIEHFSSAPTEPADGDIDVVSSEQLAVIPKSDDGDITYGSVPEQGKNPDNDAQR